MIHSHGCFNHSACVDTNFFPEILHQNLKSLCVLRKKRKISLSQALGFPYASPSFHGKELTYIQEWRHQSSEAKTSGTVCGLGKCGWSPRDIQSGWPFASFLSQSRSSGQRDHGRDTCPPSHWSLPFLFCFTEWIRDIWEYKQNYQRPELQSMNKHWLLPPPNPKSQRVRSHQAMLRYPF